MPQNYDSGEDAFQAMQEAQTGGVDEAAAETVDPAYLEQTLASVRESIAQNDEPTAFESGVPSSETETMIETEAGVETIYGMNQENLNEVLRGKGYQSGELSSNDPDFDKKYKQFQNDQKQYGVARVKLFDRVLEGSASQEEVEAAVEHARSIGEKTSLDGFHGAVPKSWYANERIAAALSESSDANKKFVERIKAQYQNDELRKAGFERIDEDGSVRIYSELE